MVQRNGIYFNALALTPGGSGVQTYSRNVIAGITRATDLSVVARVQNSAQSQLPERVIADVVGDCHGVRRVVQGLRPTRSGAALIHGLDVDLPITRSIPTVATVHDLAVFDVPWAFSRFRAAGERALLKQNLRRADAIIAVSQFSADRLGHWLGLDATVTHLAPSPNTQPATPTQVEAVRHRYRLPDEFVLHVGTVEPRKGIPALASLCERLDVPLVLAGALQIDLPNAGTVRPLGYVPADDLAPLYGAATVVAYPSVYEGFGLPPIEALACGAIVVTTKVGALPEILGAGGYPLAEPGDSNDLGNLLEAALYDSEQRQGMTAAGARAISKLSWERNTAEVLEVYSGLGLQV
ncbi:MAG: glycosyltransferase family 4 protein [Acidimicrobiales bacterium]|nr:glycosyltransferase family 4 protein [Acidimicrobiales bacterium]